MPTHPESRPTAANASVAVVNGAVVLRCGRSDLELHPMWLRERSTTCGATDPVSGQRLIEPFDLRADLAVLTAHVVEGDELSVGFNDGHEMRISLRSLQAEPAEEPPPPIAWTASTVDLEMVDYRALVDDDSGVAAVALRRALAAFFEDGVFVIRGTPAEPGALHEITSCFGRVAPTNFGDLFDVRTEPTPVDLAYTPVELTAHTDQPYRSPTPGLQFLHTIVNDAPGGESTMVDGLAAVNDLAEDDPAAHHVLCTLPVEFRYDIGTDVKVHRAPIIERWPDGSLRQLRFSPRLDYAPLASGETLDAFYRGRRWLAQALNDPLRQIEYRMASGDTLVVDNHRVLHGRRAFDPTRGHRHLQGCYIDHDGPITEWILASRNGSES